MNLLLDIMDALLAAWPLVALFALFLLGWRCVRKFRIEYAEHTYATYEAQSRHEWKTIGFDAWLDQYEREQERER